MTAQRRGQPVLHLHTRLNTVQRLHAIDFDSDTLVVAAAIEYFRTHPDERHKTADPMLALAAFADISEIRRNR